jgi:retron-type reverse transcriptase
VNTGAPWLDLQEAEARVLGMQRKLHQWAVDDPDRRFDDLFNLVSDPAFLVVAWDRVSHNRGSRTAGVDGVAPNRIDDVDGFLTELRGSVKARRFTPTRVREKTIPKKGGKVRRLGIPTVADRVVQASLKLVLEPIFEADCAPRGAVYTGRGVRPLRAGCHSSWLEAEGSPVLEVQRPGGSSPDNVTEAWHCQTRRPCKQDGKG